MSVARAYYRGISFLNPRALSHLPSVEWLVSEREDERRTGRSTVLALAFLRSAIESSYPVAVFDHSASGGRVNSSHRMVNTIRSMAPESFFRSDDVLDSDGESWLGPSPGGFTPRPKVDSLFQDFRAITSLLVQLGYDPNDLASICRSAAVEHVMSR